jgi:hypothetical protein
MNILITELDIKREIEANECDHSDGFECNHCIDCGEYVPQFEPETNEDR